MYILRRISAVVVLASIGFLLLACDKERVKEFGPLKIGQPAPYRPGDPTSRPFKVIPPSKFYIYVVEKGLPTDCVFEGCGPHGEVVECIGGWISGESTNQPTAAELFGLDESDNTTSIIVVANQDSKIVGIYPNDVMQNLPDILKRHIDLIDFGSFAKKCPRTETP